MPSLFIMQGHPGSGKSTKARELALQYRAIIRSTDDLFLNHRGEYKFDPTKLGINHKKNLELSICDMKLKRNLIIDNCNTKAWHVRPYIEEAIKRGYTIQFIRCEGEYESIHKVPQHIINRMQHEMEELTVEKCLCAINPDESK